MKIQRKKRFAAEVSTGSLNDIMFFLLLFFLIVSTLANPNVIKILLPKSQASETINKQPSTLTITQEKEYFLDNNPVPAQNLENTLIEYAQKNTEASIILRFEASLTVQDLVDVMSLCSKYKIKMVLATEKAN